LSGFQAREAALVAIVNVYMGQAKKLEEQGLLQGDLTRTEKESEGNYLLYTKKKEEARIEDALDRTRLLNVSVVQNPVQPSLPTRSPFVFSLVALLLASAISIGVVFAIDYTDQSFRTPSEVLNELRIPVLAAVPIHSNGLYSANGNGNGHMNGNGNGHRPGVTIESGETNTIIEERG
jgi:hypothetical protein